MSTIIRDMKYTDWNIVSEIYKQGIETNLATFQTEVPSYEEWDKSHHADCRYVIVHDDIVVGWCALSPTSSRSVYSGVAEVSIYISLNHMGKGYGLQLMNYLIEKSEQKQFWTLYCSIMQNNIASIKLHEKSGFRTIGYREKIAKDSHGEWRNTILMERRSQKFI